MYLSGKEVKNLFDYVARRSASRGCVSQVQVSGVVAVLDCSPEPALQEKYRSYALAKDVRIGATVVIDNYELLLPHAVFKMATNDYMARGGSGFDMLLRNTTRLDTAIPIREAFIEYLRYLGPVDPDDFATAPSGERRLTMLN